MAISFNTGTTTFVTNTGTPGGHTFTIPAGVLSGDIIYVLVMCFTTATGSLTITLSSSATAPTSPGTQQNTGINAGIQVSSQVFQIVAGGSDAGATLTYGATGGTGGSYWYNVGLVAYTGANSTNPDVIAGTESFSATGTGAFTSPSATTGVSGDWQVQFGAVAPPGSPALTTPGGLTLRETILAAANAGLLLVIADSNASVGGSGTAIGNTSWTVTNAGSGNCWINSFTLGLKPPSGAATSGTVQAWSTVPVPRRRAARAVWAAGRGPAFVAVAAPVQQFRTAPRRYPARAVWRGSAPFTGFVTVAAPKQQPRLLPRRTAARAFIQFTPVVTTNAVPVAGVSGSVPVQMVQRTEVISRVTGRVVRR